MSLRMFALILLVSTGVVVAQEEAPEKDRPSLIERLLPRRDRKFERGASRQAFQEVVAPTRAGTVRILGDGEARALGTVVSTDGFVLTKASELKGSVECEFSDGRKLKAETVGINKSFDLAMLKVTADDLTTLEWGDPQAAVAGSWVATPGIAEMPLAVGVVSVEPRAIRGGILGVMLGEDEGGVRIMRVVPNSGAAKAGLQRNDLILLMNGGSVDSRDKLIEAVSSMPPGEKVSLSIRRGEEELTVTATLGSVTTTLGGARAAFQNRLGGPLSSRRAGFVSALQHDSSLRPVDCGGPLVDLDGRVVGINIARASRVSSYALPINVVLPLIDELKSGRLSPQSLALAEQIADQQRDTAVLESQARKLQRTLVELTARKNEAVAAADEGDEESQRRVEYLEKRIGKFSSELEEVQEKLNVALGRLKSLQDQSGAGDATAKK